MGGRGPEAEGQGLERNGVACGQMGSLRGNHVGSSSEGQSRELPPDMPLVIGSPHMRMEGQGPLARPTEKKEVSVSGLFPSSHLAPKSFPQDLPHPPGHQHSCDLEMVTTHPWTSKFSSLLPRA